MKPFVKWAGGKTQLLPQLDQLLPVKYERYVEPFVGGGAMLLHLRPRKVVIGDVNPLLIACWKALAAPSITFEAGLVKQLVTNSQAYNRCTVKDAWYLGLRKRDLTATSTADQAAWFMTMNRLCFNGLWRVNLQGVCNSPWGKHEKLQFDLDNLREINAYLNRPDVQAWIECGDFAKLDARCYTGEGDFWYLDPPYVPVSKTANFTAYSKGGFGLSDQQRLAAFCGDLHRRGALFMLSNSDTPEARELWSTYHVDVVRARRAINSKGDRRGHVGELVIRNYR